MWKILAKILCKIFNFGLIASDHAEDLIYEVFLEESRPVGGINLVRLEDACSSEDVSKDAKA